MLQHPDPFLYFAGAWAELDEPIRSCLTHTIDEDVKEQRHAWETLLERNRAFELALALDLVGRELASSRMGRRFEFDRKSVRKAAVELLRAESIDGRDPWGQPISSASRIVALRAIAHVTQPEDLQLVASVSAEPVSSLDWQHAWVAAVAALLSQSLIGRTHSLFEPLRSLVRNEQLAESVRREAVLAIDSSKDASAEPVLRELCRTTTGGPQVEALAALARRDVLNEEELRLVREILKTGAHTGVVQLRKPELLEAIERQSS